VVFTHLHQDHARGATWSAVDAAGHTPGHTAILVESRGERLLCVGDTFYDRLQLRRPLWCTPWDHDANQAVLSRRRLLDRAADENLLLHAYHMPFRGLASAGGAATPMT
jgi:glyoxylase-like metal-dependent hydrolase (beta-lactamase superfamily II)